MSKTDAKSKHFRGLGGCAQGKNVESFDHVKKDLKIEDEGAAEKDPAFFLKTEGLSEDMKRVMAKLYTPDALKASRLPISWCSSESRHRTGASRVHASRMLAIDMPDCSTQGTSTCGMLLTCVSACQANVAAGI